MSKKPLLDLNTDLVDLIEETRSSKARNMALIGRLGLPHTPYLYLLPFWSMKELRVTQLARAEVIKVRDEIVQRGYKLAIRGSHFLKVDDISLPNFPFPYKPGLTSLSIKIIENFVKETKNELERIFGSTATFLPNTIICSFHDASKSGGIIRMNDRIIIEAVYGDPIGLLRLNFPHETYVFLQGKLQPVELIRKELMATIVEGEPRALRVSEELSSEYILSQEEAYNIYDHFARVLKKYPKVLGAHWMICEDVGLIYFRLDTEEAK